MIEDRVERLRTLVVRLASQPGGAYPVFQLAMANVDDDERAAMHAVIAASPLAEPFAVWSNPEATRGQRALALAAYEPALAHVHALIADLRHRDDDPENEPEPELRRTIERVQPALAAGYERLLAKFVVHFHSCAEIDATRRGINYYSAQVDPLLERDDERLCFYRGGVLAGNLPLWELADAHLRHDRDGASAQMKTATFLALESPELLVSLHLYDDAREALPVLARARQLRRLAIRLGDLRGDADEGRPLFELPLEFLELARPETSTVVLPSWLAQLQHLRRLRLDFDRYPYAPTPPAPPEIPDSIGSLVQLRELSIRNARTISEQLGNLTELRSLEISGHHCIGLPASIAKLRSLERLHVELGSLEIPGLPDGFEQLTQLTDLKMTIIGGDHPPPALLRMPWLERVHILHWRAWPADDVASLEHALPNTKMFYCYPVG